MLTIERKHLELIRSHLERAYPEEGCGVLIGAPGKAGKRVVRADPVVNETPGRAGRRYLISSDAVRHAGRLAESDGLEIVGFFHSHPDAEAAPSEYDREHAWPWYSYLIVEVRDGRWRDHRCWTLADDRSRFSREELNIVEDD